MISTQIPPPHQRLASQEATGGLFSKADGGNILMKHQPHTHHCRRTIKVLSSPLLPQQQQHPHSTSTCSSPLPSSSEVLSPTTTTTSTIVTMVVKDIAPKKPRHVVSPTSSPTSCNKKKIIKVNCTFVGTSTAASSRRNSSITSNDAGRRRSSSIGTNSKFLFLDQLLMEHDHDDDGSGSTSSCRDDDAYISDDDNISCASGGSYGSLSFGDDTFLGDYDDSEDDSDYSTSSSSEDSSSDYDNEDNDHDDDRSYDSDSDEDDDFIDVPLEKDDDDDDDDDAASIASSCSSSTTPSYSSNRSSCGSTGSMSESCDDISMIDLPPPTSSQLPKKPVLFSFDPTTTAAAATSTKTTATVVPPKPSAGKRQQKKKQHQERKVKFNMKATQTIEIPHYTSFSNDELQRTYMSRLEARLIRKDVHQTIRMLESNCLTSSMTSSITRGLEKHTAQYNLKLKETLDIVYAAVNKVQSLKLPPGIMDVPATIADMCINITKASVDEAHQIALRDEEEVRLLNM